MLHRLNHLLAYPVIWLITLYQRTFSPDRSPLFSPFLRGRICAHEPHCSAYGIQVLKTYGLFPWIIYMIDRISSCTPSQHKKYDPATLRVVFASSAPIGVPFLEKISSDPRYDLVWVVTNPDVPSGRWMKVRPNIIKTTANLLLASSRGGKSENQIKRRGDRGEVATPHSLRLNSKKHGQDAKDFDQRLKNKQPDLLVVIAYGKIIPQHILDIPTIAPINVHGSLLPTYRGASPIQSVLLDDKLETGITIMRMDAGLDTGPMLSKKSFPLTIHTTALDIIEQFQEFGPQQLVDTMRDYAKGHIQESPQPQPQTALLIHGRGNSPTDWWCLIWIQKTLEKQWVNTIFPNLDYADNYDFDKTMQQLLTYNADMVIGHSSGGFLALHYAAQKHAKPILISPTCPSHSLNQNNEKSYNYSQWFTQKVEDRLGADGTKQYINFHDNDTDYWRLKDQVIAIFFGEEDKIIDQNIKEYYDWFDTRILKNRWHMWSTESTTSINEINQYIISALTITHTTKLTKSDGLIDPRNQSLHEINNIYRGCYLRPKAHFVLPESRWDHAGKSITIDQITLDETLRDQNKDQPLLRIRNSQLATNDAITSITVKPANKKAMSREEFLRGYHTAK